MYGPFYNPNGMRRRNFMNVYLRKIPYHFLNKKYITAFLIRGHHSLWNNLAVAVVVFQEKSLQEFLLNLM